MRRASLRLGLCALCLVIAGCSSRTPTPDVKMAFPVLEAVGWASELARIDSLPLQFARPSAMLGTFVANALAEASTSPAQTALLGVEVQEWLRGDGQTEDPPSDQDRYAFLQEFATGLAVDVPDLLNRSPNRGARLDAYVRDMQDLLTRALALQSDLEAEDDSLTANRKEQQSTLGRLTKAQREAVKAADFTQAGELQVQVDETEAALQETERTLREVTDVQKTLKSLLALGTERQAAMEANREALVTGLQVVDLPHAVELGVLRQDQERESRRGGNVFGEGM